MRRSVLLACGLCAWACAGRAAAARPENLLLVILDTVRADHTSAYGYARPTTPTLERLARRGLLFENAYSQSDWTIPAVASLFTGMRPQTHGTFRLMMDRLPASLETLAGIYRARGYRTAAFTGGIVDHPAYGLGRGFEVARSFGEPGLEMGSLRQPLAAALGWLRENRGAPFLLWIHGADAHIPYVCPAAQRFSYADPGYAGPARGLKMDWSFQQAFNADAAALDGWQALSPREWDRVQAVKRGPADLAYLAAQYDGCLRYEDALLSRLERAMTRLKLWDDTTLVVLGDHGEELGEHGGYGHISRAMHDEILRVPLIIVSPRTPAVERGARVRAPIELIDVLPTLLDLQGWPAPPQIEGVSLAAQVRGLPATADAERGLLASAAKNPRGPKRLDLETYRSGDWSVVREQGRWRLFDVAADPAQTRDLLAERPEVFARLASGMLELADQGGTRP